VFTNASLIDEQVLECWREYPPSSVEITLYDDDFSSKTYCNIVKLLDMGIFVLPKFTLTTTTLCYLDAVKKWTNEIGISLSIDANILDGIDPKHSGIKEKYSLSDEQKKLYVSNKHSVPQKVYGERTGFPCKSKNGIIQIMPDFSMSLCNKMKKRWNLRAIDTKVAVEELRELIEKYKSARIYGCQGCENVKLCEMCYANAELIDGMLFVPEGYCEKLANCYIGITE
jgi:hypothetical protein